MFKIGDFSKLIQVSVKKLRYYDEIGLLKPVQVDRFTGYRYYSFEQLPRLNRILALKDLGLSLEQIVQLLNEAVPANTIRGMFRQTEYTTVEKRFGIESHLPDVLHVPVRLCVRRGVIAVGNGAAMDGWELGAAAFYDTAVMRYGCGGLQPHAGVDWQRGVEAALDG